MDLAASCGTSRARAQATHAYELKVRTSTKLALFFLVAFVALRALHIEADPPNFINWCMTRELYAEPPAKAHEARNFALFGKWHLNPVDNYQFWRVQAPVWVYPLSRTFLWLGTDYPQLRGFSVAYAAIGVGLTLALAAEYLGLWGLGLVGIVLAFDRVYYHYTRVGLVEPAVSSWIALCVFALLRARKQPAWLMLAQTAFVLAFFTKQAALFAFPLIALGSWLVWRQPSASQRDTMLRWASVGYATLLALGSFVYVKSPAYLRSVAYNTGHILLGSDADHAHRWSGPLSIVTRFVDWQHYWHFFVMARFTAPIALFMLGLWLLRYYRSRELPNDFQLLVGTWFACACFAMMIIAKSELRFWTLVVQPAALLAGCGLDSAKAWLEMQRERPRYALALRWLRPALFGSVLTINAVGLFAPVFLPTYTLRDAAAELHEHFGNRDLTIVGIAAPQIVLGTPYKNFYVREQFNSSRYALKRLGITHFLFHHDWDVSKQLVSQKFPGLLPKLLPELQVSFRRLRFEIYDVRKLLRRYPD